MTFLDIVHESHSATICGLSQSPLKQPVALKKLKSHINVDVNFMHNTNRVRWAASAARPKVGHLFIRMLYWFPADRRSRWMTQIHYADPLMERCLSHTAGWDTLQCISIPLNPRANVAGPRGTFLVREHRQWSKYQFKKKLDCGNIATFNAWAGNFKKCLRLANGS